MKSSFSVGKMKVKRRSRESREPDNEYSDVPRENAAPMPSGRAPSSRKDTARPKSRIRRGNTNKIVDMLEKQNFVP